jgi:hypothetical protein
VIFAVTWKGFYVNFPQWISGAGWAPHQSSMDALIWAVREPINGCCFRIWQTILKLHYP